MDVLQLYLAILDYVVSSVLEKSEANEHKPIFYTSKVLLDAETLYLSLEKLIYAFVVSAHKLKLCLKSHTIKVVMAYPLCTMLHKPDLVGWMAMWVVELGAFDIKYDPWTAIKS